MAGKEPVFGVLSDYERYLEWVPDMVQTKVISREGSLAVCSFSVSGLKKINYTLELHHQGCDAINFRQIAGDFKHYRGMWTLECLPDAGGTLVVCHIELDSGIPLPGWILRQAMTAQLSGNLQALKKRVEGMAKTADQETSDRELQRKRGSEKILEVVRRGHTLEMWFMGDRY